MTFEVLDAGQIEHRFGIRADPGDRGLFQADGGIIVADAALEALAAGLDVRDRVRVEVVEETDDGVSAGGVRARAAVVAAGSWAPAWWVWTRRQPSRRSRTSVSAARCRR